MDTTQFSDLIETVFAIIDSRIQFIEYEQNSLLKDYKNSPPDNTSKQLSESEIFNLQLSSKLDKMIEKIEAFSKHLRLLTILRSHLKADNANLIFNLLTNNHY